MRIEIRLLFLLSLGWAADVARAQSTISLRASDTGIAVEVNGKQRLSGGIALVAGKSIVPVTQTSRGGVTQLFSSADPQSGVVLEGRIVPGDDAVVFSLLSAGKLPLQQADVAGLFFDSIARFRQGVCLWRYKPWNSWSKPMALTNSRQLPDWDVQYMYWQYDDGTYGAAMPLSGAGFRTTLGSEKDRWGSKATGFPGSEPPRRIPALAVAFGTDLFAVTEKLMAMGLRAMGKGENLRSRKTMPAFFDYLGWCTWNASEKGRLLNADFVRRAAQSLADQHVPVGWLLIDDGWLQATDGKLQALAPDPTRFPGGFKPLTTELRQRFGIRQVGVWHTINGYWNGIDPTSPLGREYAGTLFSWSQKARADLVNSPLNTYHFIRPESDSLRGFFRRWHRYLQQRGIGFVKVDNQSVTERMAVGNYPLFTLSEKMHDALNRSVRDHFDNAIINCMDMTAEAYPNLGTTAIARAVEDYFPYKSGETYDLQEGNAAAHVLQAVYNSVYFGPIAYPDFDIFESGNPNATVHAVARALNCGPVYLTDKIGETVLNVVQPLVGRDGYLFRSQTPLLPTEDCLFQVQAARPFKAWSRVRNAGLLGIWNLADTSTVVGTFCAADVRPESDSTTQFALYEHFSQTWTLTGRTDRHPVKLARMESRLQYVVPVRDGFAAFGLTEKYNAPATILTEQQTRRSVSLKLYEGGVFKAYSLRKPRQVTLNRQPFRNFTYHNQLLRVLVPPQLTKPVIDIYW